MEITEQQKAPVSYKDAILELTEQIAVLKKQNDDTQAALMKLMDGIKIMATQIQTRDNKIVADIARMDSAIVATHEYVAHKIDQHLNGRIYDNAFKQSDDFKDLSRALMKISCGLEGHIAKDTTGAHNAKSVSLVEINAALKQLLLEHDVEISFPHAPSTLLSLFYVSISFEASLAPCFLSCSIHVLYWRSAFSAKSWRFKMKLHAMCISAKMSCISLSISLASLTSSSPKTRSVYGLSMSWERT